MKTVELKLDLSKLQLTEEDKKQSAQKIINNVIQNVILAYSQQQRGFDEKERRQFYKIADALDLAEKENKETVELEDDQAGFLKKCFTETKLMPNQLLRQVENLIINIANR